MREKESAFRNITDEDASDATRRVNVSAPRTAPRPSRTAPTGRSGGEAVRRGTGSRKKKKSFFQRNRAAAIALCAVGAVLIVALIVWLCMMLSNPADDGRILNNVYAAGVNLGGMTPEEAKSALKAATDETYTKLDMVVTVQDRVENLTPQETDAKLDVDAVAQAAYQYGRTGSRAERQKARDQSKTSSYHISILPYLELNTGYIQGIVDSIGKDYSSTLSQTSYTLEGTRPDLNTPTEQIDIQTVYQTLQITMGTPEYGLDTNKLYEQILDAYNINIFQVTGELTMVSPDPFDLNALHQELCVAPVDAELDTLTYEVTPEKYGYGFDLEQAKVALDSAKYGEVVKIDLTFLRPTFTAEELAGDLFKDILAECNLPAPIDKDTLINLKLVCRAIDGLILKADESFSFNEVVGQPTEAKGYKSVMTYVGKTCKEVVGGGLSQVSSALYYCALSSDLKITERHSHVYAPGFIQAGIDADVSHGTMDLKFKNTTGRPIRIDAEVTDGNVLKVTIVGTQNEEYTVEVLYETVATYQPTTLKSAMLKSNPEGYVDGEILVQPIVGCDVYTYLLYRYPDGEPVKKLVTATRYEKRDMVIVSIEELPLPPQPTDPSEPSEPSEPTAPSEPEAKN